MATAAEPAALLESARSGDRRSLARLVSLIEDRPGEAGPLLSRLYPQSASARVVGITGAPGAGKSTLADRLVGIARTEGLDVAVVAVDPSSPFTGGSLLGDRVRMQGRVDDPGVYVRSMSSRGHLGGLADASGRVTVLLGAVGFDLVLVETVGVGQSEVEIIETAGTVVVVTAPGMGDGIQAAKAGLLEVGDVFAVNKADRPGADEAVRDLEQMIQLGPSRPWRPPVVACSATTGEGIDLLWQEISTHGVHLADPTRASERRRLQAAMQIRRAAVARLDDRLAGALDETLVDEVAAFRLDPWTAASGLLDRP